MHVGSAFERTQQATASIAGRAVNALDRDRANDDLLLTKLGFERETVVPPPSLIEHPGHCAVHAATSP
jgi:hypothetical protein